MAVAEPEGADEVNMTEFAGYTAMAEKNPTLAAETLLGKMKEKDGKTVALLLDASQWCEEDITTFTVPVLIEGVWGRFWLVQSKMRAGLLKPEAPVVTLRGLKRLGRGLVTVMAR